jgi:asparagine synthase (glutamine-hydrolysing)
MHGRTSASHASVTRAIAFTISTLCGIGGILRTDGQPIPEEWLDAIDARIAWRGPDGHGRFRDRVEIDDPSAPVGRRVVEVAFVHRRLSIIDHAGGHQPMVSERGRNENEDLVAVVFNGCIYNHRELRKELEARGHEFVTDHSDTEVLIHGWREWGGDLPQHLEGMYAFAIWDRARQILALASDVFGKKPLYYIQSVDDSTTGIFGFASEPRALGAIAGEFPPADDFMHVIQWAQSYLLLGYVVPGQPISQLNERDVGQLAPGRMVEFPIDIRRNLPQTVQALQGRASKSQPLEELLEQAVARRLEADVPLGVFLSGGVDSSLVAALARKHVPDLATFSVRMPDRRFDESAHAKRVASHLGTHHTTLDVRPSPAEDLLLLIDRIGQPFGDSSILPTFWVSQAAREHVKVALSGDGGDELFFGYERYAAAEIVHNFHTLLALVPSSELLQFHPKHVLNKFGRLADIARDYPALGLLALESLFTMEQIRELTGEEPDPVVAIHPEGDARTVLRTVDMWCYLPGDLLRKVDSASMACGLEVRCPFLDRDLASAALAMPVKQLMPRGQRKGLLRQIARQYLPKEIIDRRKMGFAIPIGEWFRDDDLPHKGSGVKTLLLDHLNSAEPFGPLQLNRKAVQRYIREHMSLKRDHGQKLFTLLTLSIWARQINAACGKAPAT